jgi:acyl-coenzyme A synthetase/AMP-(fatty) acid ligase
MAVRAEELAVEVVDLEQSLLRELNARLHELATAPGPRHWRILNPNGAHAVACGLDADVEIEIVDHLGATLPIGAEGFIRLRSPQFIKNFGVTDSSTWFYPGDLGSLTPDGVLCVMGRTGDVVNRGGAKLSATEFESFLMACAGVKDAGICTHTGSAGFEEVWVGVVLDPSIDMAAFRHHIESDKEFGTNIDKLFVVQSIPRNELGKIQQGQLKEMLQSIYEDSPSPS